ncbi:MAG: TAT-variant-translocated molybdopterin oxidoreductase [Bdellovibrionota bacterium]
MDQQQNESSTNTKKYWRSIEDLLEGNAKTDESGEFAMSPTREGQSEEATDGHSRREFLKLMGASFALMGASACTRRPAEKILPYVNKPSEVVPGVANWYASVCGECESGCGVLVKTREGRPIKFEGNPKHPLSEGKLCARGQASILNLYDPDRLQAALSPGRKGVATGTTWEKLDADVVAKIQNARASGKKVRVLTGEVGGPSTEKLVQEFLSGTGNSKHVVYDVLGNDEIATAAALSYGERVVPHYRFEKAEMIVSFGADFLGTWLSPVEFGRGFSKNRKVGKNAVGNPKDMSRFVAFESVMTLTGTNADQRHRVKSGEEALAAMALAYELIVTQGRTRYAGDSNVRAALGSGASAAQTLGIPAEVFKKTAQDLWERRGKSIVVGGGQSAKGPHALQLEVLVNLLNSALENEGVTVDGTTNPARDRSSYQDLAQLIGEMKSGQVGVLFIHRSNPVYSLPKSMGFTEALGKVGLVVYFGDKFDETARVSDHVCATPHSTEAWGDSSPYTGVYAIQQPTISPLYKTRGFEESLMVWAKQLHLSGAIAAQPNWHEYLKAYWRDTVHRQSGSGAPFDLFWEEALREGVVLTSAARAQTSRPRSFSANSLGFGGTGKVASVQGTTLALYPKVSQYDGRTANNGWLQEMPDPVTKVTWDNYALVSPGMAKQLSVKEGDVVRLKTQAGSIELPVWVQPGMHDQTVGAAVGYGRKGVGRVGDDIGVNVFPLAQASEKALALSGLAVTVEKTGATYSLAATQKHHSYEGRPIIREASLKDYQKNAHAGNEHHEHLTTIWPKHQYPGYRWGMAIDLNSCTGCSACVVACQSENNIPVVGKKFVLTSREMHWLRIDRYYTGKVEAPEVVHQPMICQHCENAPCETVCPVLATMHDHEGLNQQVYNRCVGTRYCANNCPYKVRRFNWFTFTDVASPLNLAYNPDITVRTRGVMEKCTFCVQRIRDAKDHAKDVGGKVKDGDLKTACQQTCPTDAIVFGDINDLNTRVSQIASDPRGYHVLEELNVRPSVTYLTKIRNNT